MLTRRSAGLLDSLFVLIGLVALAALGPFVRPARAGDERGLARTALARGDAQAAVEHLRRAVQALPEDARDERAAIELELGRAYLTGLGDGERALAAFLRSAALATDPATAWLWAATAADSLGRDDEAVRYRQRAISPPAAPPRAVGEDAAPAPTPPEPAAAPAEAITASADVAPAAPTPASPSTDAPVEAVVPPPTSPAPAAVEPEPRAPTPAGSPPGSAFEHFFGARREPPPEPEPESVPEPRPQPIPKPEPAGAEEPAAAVASRAPSPSPPAPVGSASTGGTDDSTSRSGTAKSGEAGPAPPAAGRTEARPAPKSGTAFDHFFKRKPAAETTERTGATPGDEPKPETGPPPRSS